VAELGAADRGVARQGGGGFHAERHLGQPPGLAAAGARRSPVLGSTRATFTTTRAIAPSS
jgi:hypothetical protein